MASDLRVPGVTYGFEVGDASYHDINNGTGYGAYNSVITGGAKFGNCYLKHARIATDAPGQLFTSIIPTFLAGPAPGFVTAQMFFWFRIPFYPSANATICGFYPSGEDGAVKERVQLCPDGTMKVFAHMSPFPCPGDSSGFVQTTGVIPLNTWVYLSLDYDISNNKTSPSDSSLVDGHGLVVCLNGVPQLGTGQTTAFGWWAGMRATSAFTLSGWILGSNEAAIVEMHFDQIRLVAGAPAAHFSNSVCVGAGPPTCPSLIFTNDCNALRPEFGGYAGDPTLGGPPHRQGPFNIPYYPYFVPPTIPPPSDDPPVPGPPPSSPPDEPPGPAPPPCVEVSCRLVEDVAVDSGGGAGCPTDVNAPVADGGCP